MKLFRASRTLGVLGGAFDPPHLGHALMPAYVRARGLADAVVVAPCADHPLGKAMSPFEDRLAWTRAAFEAAGDVVEVSAIEAELEAPNYTLRLLEAVARRYPAARVRLIVGGDIVHSGETARWHRWDEIVASFDPIVVPRAGIGDDLAALPDISSTDIRRWIDGGDWASVQAAVPARVVNLLRGGSGPPVWIVGRGNVAAHAVPWLRGRGFAVEQLSGRDLRLPKGPTAGVWLLVRNEALPEVAAKLAASLAPGTPVLHAAGALVAAQVLAPLREAGFPVGTLHSICSTRAERPWPTRLNECAFGLEGAPEAVALARRLIGDNTVLDLQALDATGRVTYHAACSLLANHLSVIFDAGRTILIDQGHAPEHVDAAAGTLLISALENLLALGIPGGITGPLVRGDHAAVQAHLDALHGGPADLYRVLSGRLAQLVGR